MIPAPLRHAGIAALALWTAVAQAVPPERITLTYELKRNSLVVDVSETLEHDGRTYVITSGCVPMNSATSAPEVGLCPRNSTGTRAR